MMPNSKVDPALEDSELVGLSLAGSREAFSHIVARYQSLVCSLAFSATGNLSQSEDLAQETFLTVWKKLPTLREPGSLRPWICGIARHLISDALRRDTREPSHHADSLELAHGLPTSHPSPTEEVVSREEEALLWRSLESIPPVYREPLVLFYREHRSVQSVAAALDLTPEAVKQRLSRGRRLLHEQVLEVVERSLERSRPGKAFTLGVLAGLPALATSASAATVASAGIKGGTALKAAACAGVSGAVLGPLLGLLGAWFGVKASLASATSAQERRLVIRFTWYVAALVVFGLAVQGLVVFGVHRLSSVTPAVWAFLLLGGILLYAGLLVALIFRFNSLQRQLRLRTKEPAAAEGHPHDSQLTAPAPASAVKTFEFRSRSSFLGLPLVHIRLGRRPEDKLRPAIGWVAIGDAAVGVLFAAGAFAAGGISFGGLTVGVISLGGLAAGGLVVGGLAIGFWALGGAALGYLALGGCAIGWHAAMGGLAVAAHAAIGGLAQAQHANDPVARELIKTIPFFHYGTSWIAHSRWLVLLCVIPVFISMLAWLQGKRNANRPPPEP